MPQIPVYNAPEQESNLRIPEGGAQFLSQGARRLGVMGQEADTSITQGTRQLAAGVEDVGKVLNEHQYNADASTMHKDVTDVEAYASDMIGAAEAAHPNDRQAALNSINQNLDELKEQYASKYTLPESQKKFGELWDQRADAIRRDLITSSAKASGDQALANITASLDTSVGMLSSNPSMELFDRRMAYDDQNIDDHANMIPGDKRQQAVIELKTKQHERLATTTLERMAITDPAQAKAILDSGRLDQYLVGHEKNTLYNTVDNAAGHHAMDAERAARNQVDDTKRASWEQANTYLTALSQTTDPTTGAIRTPSDFNKTVLTDPKLDKEDKQNLIEFGARMDRNAGKEVQSAPGLLNEFAQRLALPQGDHNRPDNSEILKHMGKDLSLADGKFLLQQNQVHTPNDKLGQNQVATNYRMLTGFFTNPALPGNSTPGGLAASKLNADRAHAWFNTAIQAGLERGLTLLQLTSPGDPNYILGKVDPTTGIPENLALIPGLVGNPFAAPTGTDTKSWGDTLRGLWNTLTDPHWLSGSNEGSGASGGSQLASEVINNESSDRNVTNPTPTSSGNAEGFFQITTGTWKDFAPAEILKRYPTAISAPPEVQHQVAQNIPLRRWAPETIAAVRRRFGPVDTSKTIGELEAELG